MYRLTFCLLFFLLVELEIKYTFSIITYYLTNNMLLDPVKCIGQSLINAQSWGLNTDVNITIVYPYLLA